MEAWGRGRGGPSGGGSGGPRVLGKRPLSPRSQGLDDEARDAGFAGISDRAWRLRKRAEIDEMTLEEAGLWAASPPPSPPGGGTPPLEAAGEGVAAVGGGGIPGGDGGSPPAPGARAGRDESGGPSGLGGHPEGGPGGGDAVARLRAELEQHLEVPPGRPHSIAPGS